MAKLIGTDPNQVPTNADLGTMAYQDKDNFNLGGANNSESKLVMGKFTDRDVLYQYGENTPTLMVQNDDYSSNDGVGIILDSNQRAGFYTENGDAHLRTWIKHPVNATYGHFIYQVAVGVDDPENNGTEVFRIKGSGDILPQGNVVMPNGKGIDFSATGNGSGTMTSELLDDYEEGTWTPTIRGGTTDGTTSYTERLGYYTKIGRQVIVSINCAFTTSGGSGQLEVAGLPFTSASSQEAAGTFQANSMQLSYQSNVAQYNSVLQSNVSYFHFRGTKNNGGSHDNLQIQNINYLRATIAYITN